MTIFSFIEFLAAISVAVYGFLTLGNASSLKWVKYYCYTNAFFDVIAITLSLNKVNNILVIYLLLLAEVYILFKYFREVSKAISKINEFATLAIVYILLLIIILCLDGFGKFNTYGLILEGVFVFLCSLSFFIEQARSPKQLLIFSNSDFWFSSGFLIYYGGTWLILIGAKYVLTDFKQFVYLWDIQNIISVLKYLAIALGFYQIKKA